VRQQGNGREQFRRGNARCSSCRSVNTLDILMVSSLPAPRYAALLLYSCRPPFKVFSMVLAIACVASALSRHREGASSYVRARQAREISRVAPEAMPIRAAARSVPNPARDD